ncbi:adenine deaminase C-terminal domain-containing protein [Paenibacillus ginsengarvi]|uniref:Adenine deaminase n=1 Tax=Paenibacillus ginsengarvi TaxID=400777 RepID=A0A3B0BQC8_9BACL|nr:adenine deaminase C-terminal domain-containing protein [Paenibacillus ginsengarvi]RKN74227.1 adenine deaminase [Paenibacillus ginsengarvi]
MLADLLIVNVRVFNSALKTFYKANVAVKDGKFLYVGSQGPETIAAASVIDGRGRAMIPGLIDIHLHIESTMVTPRTFSHGIIRCGVTSIVADPHEMANVFGIRGIREMIEAGRACSADMFWGIPSSVPATLLETTGGTVGVEEIDELLAVDGVVCLGEVMDYADMAANPDGRTNRILRHVRTRYPQLPIEGHCPKLVDVELSRFVYAGIDSDHTQMTVEEFEERIRAGMFIEIQEKSMTPELIRHLVDHDRSEHFCFVTDDVMPDTFVKLGHLDHLVRKAIRMGMEPEAAIYAATMTPAKRMNLRDRGRIAPNRIADFVLLNDVRELAVGEVFKGGVKAYDASEPYEEEPAERQFPSDFYTSVKLSPVGSADFTVTAPANSGEQSCRIIMVGDGSTFTREHIDNVPVRGGELLWEQSPYSLIAIMERYGINGNRALGLVGGDAIREGAIATTYAHDNHNLLVLGRSKADMELAANTVIGRQGGYCVVLGGEVIAFLPLPVGGILSEATLDELAVETARLREAMKRLGYRHYNPIMSLSTLSLPVSPALKITDFGLIRTKEGKVVDLFV